MDLTTAKANFIATRGDPVTIIRTSGNLQTTARIVSMKVSSSSKTAAVTMNYIRIGMFLPTCGLERGDLITNNATGEQFLVRAFQDKTIQGDVSSLNALLMRTNYTAVTITRLTTSYDTNGNPDGSAWTTIGTVPMNVEHVNGNTPYKDGLLMQETTFLLTLQTGVSLLLEDRVVIDGKPYQVSDINLSVIDGLQVVQVKVDSR